jgi:hypothetical protein
MLSAHIAATGWDWRTGRRSNAAGATKHGDLEVGSVLKLHDFRRRSSSLRPHRDPIWLGNPYLGIWSA